MLVGVFADVDVVMPVAEDSVDDLRELAGDGEDGDRGAFRRAMRRYSAPSAVLDRCIETAARRSTAATRLAPRPFRRFLRGLLPEMGVCGHKRSQETKCFSVGKAARVGADLGEEGQRGAGVGAVDSREVGERRETNYEHGSVRGATASVRS